LAEQPKQLTITEQIDADEGLMSKRKLLTVTSLILLALSFSGAKVEEANTFILKLSFENQHGISVLLVLAVFFLSIRYFNYAKPYHRQLYELWSSRMLADSYFILHDPHGGDPVGLIVEKEPKDLNVEEVRYEGGGMSCSYKCSRIFTRALSYSVWNRHEEYEIDVNVGREHYLQCLRLEAGYQFESFFSYRENLDIQAPYLLAVLSILSYFFNEQLQLVLNLLSV